MQYYARIVAQHSPDLSYSNACLAVASLTDAWRYVLGINPANRADTIDQIERALESAVRLRERLKPPNT
jgi:hypothetical protein